MFPRAEQLSATGAPMTKTRYSALTLTTFIATLFAFALGCGGGGPSVTSTLPSDGTTDFPRNGRIIATFSEAMDRATLSTTTFTLTRGAPATSVSGNVSYGNSRAEFFPSAHLDPGTRYTATVTTGVQ